MSIDLADLREVEHVMIKRMNRIEAGMDIIMHALQDTLPYGEIVRSWDRWKGSREVEYIDGEYQ
jgi:hypothetical protein